MEGNSSIACNDGDWNSRIPACRRTSSKNDFSGTTINYVTQAWYNIFYIVFPLQNWCFKIVNVVFSYIKSRHIFWIMNTKVKILRWWYYIVYSEKALCFACTCKFSIILRGSFMHQKIINRGPPNLRRERYQTFVTRCQFHQLSVRSFYARWSRKRKKDWQLDCFFYTSGICARKSCT